MGVDWINRAQGLKFNVRNFVDGRWEDSGGATLEKKGPRDGRLLYCFGSGDMQSVERVIASSRRAVEDGRWGNLQVQRRKEILVRFAVLIEEHREELALLESLDTGKPISDVLNIDIPIAAQVLRYNAEAADKLHSKVYATDASSLAYQLRRPVGLVAGIVGWNFPLVLAAMKVGPALATGNCLLLKPSELTPLSTPRMAELAVEGGVPEGVFNVIHGGANVGSALAQHHAVELLTFTGSSHTGRQLLVAAGQSNMKRLILECGGKAPDIVFDDVPQLDVVAAAVLNRAFWNQGQVCSASSRLLVEESIRDELIQLIVQKAAGWIPGDPLKADTTFGALVSAQHMQKVLGYVEVGKQEGARLFHQSGCIPPVPGGYYVPATIFDHVLPEHRIAQEEIFGPVLSVIGFRDEAEAIRIANSTRYGLTAIAWTGSLRRAHRLSHGIRAGSVVINATATPLGGPNDTILSVGGHKQSGQGVEGGLEGLEAYTTQTAVQFFV
jgi:acyl-CoA reductase-like NAD-dependent aldehyde dehydrogenase